MAFLTVSRAVPGLFRAARPTVVRPQLYRQIARRTYASGGHGSAKSSGDAVWAATSIAVTVPTCWYLLRNAPDTSHGHDDHGDAHGKQHEEEESMDEGSEEKSDDREQRSEAKSDAGEDKADDNESEKSEDSGSGGEEKGADTPDTSDDEGEGEAKEPSDDKNTRKSIPDAKGGSKARLESNKGNKQGEGDAPEDKSATSGPAGDQNTQSGKQEGLSNTDTKHSTDMTNNPDKSRKGEGVPETAKSKGPVDPNRPQPESK